LLHGYDIARVGLVAPIRLATIGAGRRGWIHIALKGTPDYEIAARADPTPEFPRAAMLAPGAVDESGGLPLS
jgi:hypothetical protein